MRLIRIPIFLVVTLTAITLLSLLPTQKAQRNRAAAARHSFPRSADELKQLAIKLEEDRSGPTAIIDSMIPTASCADCAQVNDTCLDASYSIYNACRAGGASYASCDADMMTWYRGCVRASQCVPTYE